MQMKNEVITVQTKNQGLLTYLKIDNISSLVKLHHKLRVKQVIYGRLFHTYNNEMDFSNSDIVVDNR